MKREDLTEKLLDIKREKGWTWNYIQEQIAGISPILVTAACMGQMKLPKAQAKKAAELFSPKLRSGSSTRPPIAARLHKCRRPIL